MTNSCAKRVEGGVGPAIEGSTFKTRGGVKI